jgi:hypothetical protein
MSSDPGKPVTPVVFTEMEIMANNKITTEIQKAFYQQHQEIASPSNSDLENMMRQGKQVYVNMAINYTVQLMAANAKRKSS